MKQTIIALIVLCSLLQSNILHAQKHVFSGPFEECKAKAQSENKLIIIDLYFEGCLPCKEMDNKVFPNEEVLKVLEPNFLLYKTDVFKELDGKKLARKYAAGGFPTYVIVNAEGKALDLESGFMGVERFTTFLNKSLKLSYSNQFLAFDKDLNKEYPGVYNYRFMKEGDRSTQLIEFLKNKNLSDEVPFVVSTLVKDQSVDSYILENVELLQNKFGGQVLRKKIISIAQEKTNQYGTSKNNKEFHELMKTIKSIFNDKLWAVYSKEFISTYYKSSGDAESFVDNVTKYQDVIVWDEISNMIGNMLMSGNLSNEVYNKILNLYLSRSNRENLRPIDQYKLALIYAKINDFKNGQNIVNKLKNNSEVNKDLSPNSINELELAIKSKNINELKLPKLSVLIPITFD